MTKRLPPFASLVAFDAVVRHRSFTRAADELSVTQSAISHQMRRLEEFFGVQLLKRLHPGIDLSSEGAKLHGQLAPLLDGIADLKPSLRHRPGLQTLRVGAGSSLATWWLVRRLREFRVLHPGIEIDCLPFESTAVDGPAVDVRILWTSIEGADATSVQVPLFREQVFPVCSPSILPGGRPLADPAELLDLPLIQKAHTPAGEWSWAYWFENLGLKHAKQRGLVMGDVGLCLTSAVEGAGVAIGHSLLVADAISDGRLVPALSATPYVLSTKIHIARWASDLIRDSNTQVLVSWLAEAAEETSRRVQNTLSLSSLGAGTASVHSMAHRGGLASLAVNRRG
jgi:LysR family glycine cleavage system transcriptional activator